MQKMKLFMGFQKMQKFILDVGILQVNMSMFDEMALNGETYRKGPTIMKKIQSLTLIDNDGNRE